MNNTNFGNVCPRTPPRPPNGINEIRNKNLNTPGGTPTLSWSDTLEILEETLVGSGSLYADTLKHIDTCHHLLSQFETTIETGQARAHRAKSNLTQKVQEAEHAQHEETKSLKAQQNELTELENDVNQLKDLIRQKENEIGDAMERIKMYEAEANQEVEKIDEVEAQMLREVPRLKKKMALYANVTGIKWKYNNENMREGEIAISSKGEVRRFSFDPLEHTDYEMANKLWDMMDGQSQFLC